MLLFIIKLHDINLITIFESIIHKTFFCHFKILKELERLQKKTPMCFGLLLSVIIPII